MVITSGAAVTVSVKEVLAFAPLASVTVALTVAAPMAVGVPDMAPEELPDKPAGRPPNDQVYGVVPPVALNPAE